MKNNVKLLLEAYPAEQELSQLEPFRRELVTDNMKLPGFVAEKFLGRGVDYDDLYQIAFIGLIKAAEKYDPDRKIKFSTFATTVMRNEVRMFFEKHNRWMRKNILPDETFWLGIEPAMAGAARE